MTAARRENLPKILIYMKDERIEGLKEVFELLKSKNVGKSTSDYYICSSSITIKGDKPEYILFNSLQERSLEQGFEKSAYSFVI